MNDGSRNPVLIPQKKTERKTSTEILAAEKGTWKQEVTLLKGLKPTDIKELLPTYISSQRITRVLTLS